MLGLLRIKAWVGDMLAILEQAARLALAIAVMSAALGGWMLHVLLWNVLRRSA